MPKKVYEIAPGDKNLVSKCAGIIRDILTSQRVKFTDSWEVTFDLFVTKVRIHPDLWKQNPSGEIKWKQHVYNIAKLHPNKKGPDIMTSGELIALEQDGGFALPNHVPKGRTSVAFPVKKGLDIKAESTPRRRTKKLPTVSGHRHVPEPTGSIKVEVGKIVAGLRRIVANMRDSVRDAVAAEIFDQINEGQWTFDDTGEK